MQARAEQTDASHAQLATPTCLAQYPQCATITDTLAVGRRADLLPEHRHLLQFAAGDKVTAHPGAAETLGLPMVRGVVARAFIKRFNKLAPAHQAKWYARAREQLEQLWEEAGVHDWYVSSAPRCLYMHGKCAHVFYTATNLLPCCAATDAQGSTTVSEAPLLGRGD